MAFDKRKALQNALSYTQQGKWDKAIAEYQSIVKADPRDLTVCNNLGDLFARAGRSVEAIEQYLKLGELYRADGLSVKAIAVYKKIAKLDPSRTAAYLACADLYQEQGLVGEAKLQLATVAEHYSRASEMEKLIGVYQRLAQLDPSNYVLAAKVADLLNREGMREEAAAEYTRAAEAAQAAGQIVEGKRLLEKAQEVLPDSAEINLSLGEWHLKGKHYAEAVDALSKAAAIEPDNARAWRHLGEAYVGLDRLEDACAALQHVLRLGHPEASVARPLSTALIKAGRVEEAIAFCRKAAEAAENPDSAVVLFEDLLSTFPNVAPLHGLLADLLQSLGRKEEARSAMRGEAAAHEASGETEPAMEVYRRLLESDPSDAEIRERMEVLEATRQARAPVEEVAEPAGVGLPLSADIAAPEVPPAVTEEARLISEADSGLPLECSIEAASDVQPVLPPRPPVDAGPSPGSAEEILSALELESTLKGAMVPGEAPVGPAAGTHAEYAGAIGMPLRDSETDGLSLDPSASVEPAALTEAEAGFGFSQAEDGASIDFLGEGDTGLGELVAEEEDADKVTEQLAEAEVYLKYGLAEKARERLQEAVHLAPDNLIAHRKLKAIYLERDQAAEACGEILTIVRLLSARHQGEAALRELQEGLSLAQGHPELMAALEAVQREGVVRAAESLAAPPALVEFARALAPPPNAADPDVPAALALADVEESARRETTGPSNRPGEVAGELQVEPLNLDGVEAPAVSLAGAELGEATLSLDEGELPPELRALLEGSDEGPTFMMEAGTTVFDHAMTDDLAEAEFYLAQGMREEARSVLRRMEERDAAHPAVADLRTKLAEAGVSADVGGAAPTVDQREIPSEPFLSGETLFGLEVEKGLAEPAPSAEMGGAAEWLPQGSIEPPARDQGPPRGEVASPFTVRTEGESPGSGGLVNLGAELEQEVGPTEEGTAPASGPLMDGLLEEIQKGAREHLDERDYETHYNLGIAYKEMELYEEAIQEFRLAAEDPARAIVCANLLGLCFLAIGQPDQAIAAFRTGLDVSGQSREAYHPLRYDLGVAYETKGDLSCALEQYELLLGEDARFRDVRMRVQTLQDRLQRRRVPPVAPSPTARPSVPRRASDKKISFI